MPVSGEPALFQGSDEWLKVLAAKPQFAVRLGMLKSRGFEPRQVPIASADLSDEDFKPRFEQKGVDMRIGLDIASYAVDRSIDRIILVTGDTDCLPAMKRAGPPGCRSQLFSSRSSDSQENSCGTPTSKGWSNGPSRTDARHAVGVSGSQWAGRLIRHCFTPRELCIVANGRAECSVLSPVFDLKGVSERQFRARHICSC